MATTEFWYPELCQSRLLARRRPPPHPFNERVGHVDAGRFQTDGTAFHSRAAQRTRSAYAFTHDRPYHTHTCAHTCVTVSHTHTQPRFAHVAAEDRSEDAHLAHDAENGAARGALRRGGVGDRARQQSGERPNRRARTVFPSKLECHTVIVVEAPVMHPVKCPLGSARTSIGMEKATKPDGRAASECLKWLR
jgi:hypothetical protein